MTNAGQLVSTLKAVFTHFLSACIGYLASGQHRPSCTHAKIDSNTFYLSANRTTCIGYLVFSQHRPSCKNANKKL